MAGRCTDGAPTPSRSPGGWVPSGLYFAQPPSRCGLSLIASTNENAPCGACRWRRGRDCSPFAQANGSALRARAARVRRQFPVLSPSEPDVASHPSLPPTKTPLAGRVVGGEGGIARHSLRRMARPFGPALRASGDSPPDCRRANPTWLLTHPHHQRKRPLRGVSLAERVGFEPTVRGYRTPDFESGTFDHSATSPGSIRIGRDRSADCSAA